MKHDIILATYQAKTMEASVIYQTKEGEDPSYFYLECDLDGVERMKSELDVEPWTLSPTQSLEHPNFNWPHYLFDRAVIRKSDNRTLSKPQFEELLLQISEEMEGANGRYVSILAVKDLRLEEVLSCVKAFSSDHPHLLFLIRDRSIKNRGSVVELFIGKRSRWDDLISSTDLIGLIQLAEITNPTVAESLKTDWEMLSPIYPVYLSYVELNPTTLDKAIIQIQSGHKVTAPLPVPAILEELPDETLHFLDLLANGYPLGVDY